MRSGLKGTLVALLLVPAAAGCVDAGQAGQSSLYGAPAWRSSAWQGSPAWSSPAYGYGGWTRMADCDGNDCRHDGGPGDRPDWYKQRQQRNDRPYDNSWWHGNQKADPVARGGPPPWWAWNRGNDRRGYDRGDWDRDNWRNGNSNRRTGERAACLDRHASHEDCSKLPR